jgi:hypothetical protein
LKNTRNAIAHGHTASMGWNDKNGKSQSAYRLMPQFGDTIRFPRYRNKSGLPGLPGLGSNEITLHVQAVWRVATRVHEIQELFRVRMLLVLTPHPPEVLKKLHELVRQIEDL